MKTNILGIIFAAIANAFTGRVTLANESAPPDVAQVFLANEVKPDATGKVEWLIVPYGQFDHSKGLQIFDKAAAVAMANEFHNPIAAIGRAISGGVPFYVGHPDDPAFANEAKDKRAYAWVKELKAQEDGLHIRIKPTPLGEAMLANEEYKFFSPRWSAEPVAGRTRVYRPVRLRSAGFTNDPNIPVSALSNEMMAAPLPDWLAEALGVPVDAEKDAVLAAIAAKVESGAAPKVDAMKAEKESAEAKTLKELAAKEEAELALENTRKELREMILSNAVKEKRITAADVPAWATRLEKDFANERTALAGLKVALPGGGKTADLGKQKSDNKTEDLATLANERAKSTGEDYATAWRIVSAQKTPAA